MVYIAIRQLNKTFFPHTNRAHHALKAIDLQIEEGDFITIVGGNGAGKSTFLNAMAGSFALDSGQIEIAGEQMEQMPEYRRARLISRVFQDPMQGTAPRMTVAQNIALAMRRGQKRSLFASSVKAEDVTVMMQQLEHLELGLETRLDSEMGVLSGGQRQAIALLMATIRPPKLLLLDEHTAALDPKTQRKIMTLTDTIIKEKRLTALMITHNLQDALQYGNRLLMMHQGEIVRDIQAQEKQQLTVDKLYGMLAELDQL